MIRLLVAEDQAMIRGALIALLAGQPDIETVGEAATGEEAVGEALRLQPDVALLDIEMPGRGGLWAAAELGQRLPSCRVLILTVFGRATCAVPSTAASRASCSRTRLPVSWRTRCAGPPRARR